MRIEFDTLDDFLAELVPLCAAPQCLVMDRLVRVDVRVYNRDPDGTAQDVAFWATCRALSDSGERDILEYGWVGENTQQNADEGEKQAVAMRERVAQVCKGLGLQTRAGKIELL